MGIWPKIFGHRPFAEETHTHVEADVTDLGDYQPINHDAILTVDGTYQGETATVTVDDASAAFGNALYLAADFHYERCDADAAATMPCTALALESGAGTKLILKRGQICDTDWNWSAGVVFVSTTTGALTQAAPSASGDQVQVAGWALSADTIYFDPDQTLLEIA